nr:MAG TPA: Myb2 [Caudoviricetes sp.]
MEDSKRGNMKKYRRWTDEEIELLKSFVADGESVASIAKKLNRERSSVRFKKKALAEGNLRSSKMFWTVEELKTLKELRQKGLTVKQIAEAMGRSFSSVMNKLYIIGTDIWHEESYQIYVC